MNELSSGTQLCGGKYRIVRTLGHGGFGITYLAMSKEKVDGKIGSFDVEINVAIKEFFISELCKRETGSGMVSAVNDEAGERIVGYKEKFLREVRKIAGIYHEHIVKVSDIFEENNTVYYVMQYLEGGSLLQLVQKGNEGKPLSEEQAFKYVRQVATALDYLHQTKKMCHLDVKPENIMLDAKGNAMLIDFGISKTYGKEGKEATKLAGGYSKGYSSMEQQGGALQAFSPQADIYSLGATMLFLLTGKEPPDAREVWLKEGLGDRPDTLSERAWEIIRQAMQPKPKDRIPTMKAFIAMIDEAEGGQVKRESHDTLLVEEEEPGPEPHVPSHLRRRWVIPGACVAALAVALMVLLPRFLPQGNGHGEESAGKAGQDAIPDVKEVKGFHWNDMTYTGTVKDSVPHGRGKAIYNDGRQYEGCFVNGMREDKEARFVYKNKNVFVGEFVADTIKSGRATTADGQYVFEGDFCDGAPWNGVWRATKDATTLSRVVNGENVEEAL